MQKIIVLMASFLAMGCVHRENYQDSVVANEGQFNGTYSGTAEVVISKTTNAKSTSTFGLIKEDLGSIDENSEIANHDVKITVNNGLLMAQDIKTNAVISCPYIYINGRIEIDTNTKYRIYLLINGSKSRTITLSLDKNGDLVVDDNFYSVGWFLIFPTGYCRNDIYRAKRL